MSKRLQIVIGDAQLERFEAAARASGLTLSAWARDALRAAELRTALGDAENKLAAVRAAARHAFPAPDIDEMNHEIARGYVNDGSA